MTGEHPHKIKGKVITASIEKRVDLTPEHFKIWLAPSEPFEFAPGQYCTLGVDGIERPYSIVSSPREELLELFVELIPPPEGHLTPLLHELTVGDVVTMRPRGKGVFRLHPEFRHHVMVATVTGIAPFVSILRHWLAGAPDEQRMYVLDGASFIDEFAYDGELNAMAARCPNIKFVPTCSRPRDPRNTGWRGQTGRVHTLLERYRQEWQLDAAHTCIYTCGHPLMIADVHARFADLGFHLEEERYWKQT